MTNVKSSRKALLLSVVSLLLCFAMLLGTTYAWFTDSASSGSNVITSGNLDIEVEYTLDGTTWNKLDGANDLFQKGLWEPGHTEVVAVKVINNGSLALKYMANMNITKEFVGTSVNGDPIKLSDILTVDSLVTTSEADVAAAFSTDSEITGATKAAFKDANILANSDTLLQKGEFKYIIIKVDMAETVGNEANHNGIDIPSITFGLNFMATQFTHETDSFGPDYDQDSNYPAEGSVNVPGNSVYPTEVVAGDVTVHIPAMANEGEYKLYVSNKVLEETAAGTVASFDIDLTRDGASVSGVTYEVSIDVGTYLNILSLTHNGEAITNFSYDAVQGVISFETQSFSPFAVTYESALGEDAVIADGKIIAGTFDVNPVTLDPTLGETDSEYIAINYEIGGQTKFVVAKRSETVVLSATDTTPINSNYTVTNAAGKLYSPISALQNNEHSTVYLLPGTYNEGTTIYVYSSMDIIGLGDKDSVRVIKQSSSKSNRHLFNCNGTKEDYIQVTLRNMYLDSTANATTGEDNGAVQSIRKTKVKCYDLTIVDNSTAAFYVNAKKKVNNQTFPAYMYAENCVVNATSAGTVVDNRMAGNAYFYYNNLFYANGEKEYTSTSSLIKHEAMAADDWDW